jgi:hypothetical protein
MREQEDKKLLIDKMSEDKMPLYNMPKYKMLFD